ncbi:MAG: hypothetical protein IJV01_06270 [Bacteroidales bacterium]|nr:hypothetical protein [Bacteroidales bacterium]
MYYRYRVTLEGIKGFYRVYVVSGSNSLYTFHKQLRSDLEFPVDQPILFKAFDEKGAVLARYALIDLGCGTVDEISIEDTVKAGIVRFVYFYDVTSKKSVTICLEGESELPVTLPTIVESKGPVPSEFENGYVAFEDLPDNKRKLPTDDGEEDDEEDDDDEEEDEEDEDREEEELLYDAEE